jgi:hypothetical protein
MPLAGRNLGTQGVTLSARAGHDGDVTMRRRRRPVSDGARFTADPGPPARTRLDRIRAKAPLLLALATEPIRQAKVAAEAAQLARARRVGRDLGVVNRSDYGPGIRLEAIRAHDRAIVREADVEVVDAPDPHVPTVTLRRARRTDPLEVLKRAGTDGEGGAEGYAAAVTRDQARIMFDGSDRSIALRSFSPASRSRALASS